MGWTYVDYNGESKREFFEREFHTTFQEFCDYGNHIWIKEKNVIYCVLVDVGFVDGQCQLGYKEISMDEGPYEYDCPIQFLEGIKELNTYGNEWKNRVEQYHRMDNDPAIDSYLQAQGRFKILYLGSYYAHVRYIRTGYRITIFNHKNEMMKDYWKDYQSSGKVPPSSHEMWNEAFEKVWKIAEDMGYYTQP